jgi:hypothetical protein
MYRVNVTFDLGDGAGLQQQEFTSTRPPAVTKAGELSLLTETLPGKWEIDGVWAPGKWAAFAVEIIEP